MVETQVAAALLHGTPPMIPRTVFDFNSPTHQFRPVPASGTVTLLPLPSCRFCSSRLPDRRPAADYGDFARFPCLFTCLALQCPRGLGDYCAFEVEVHQRATESVEFVAS